MPTPPSPSFLRNEQGQAMVEYTLILAACVVGVVGLVKAIFNGVDQGILRLGYVLEKDLKTGRAGLHVWSN